MLCLVVRAEQAKDSGRGAALIMRANDQAACVKSFCESSTTFLPRCRCDRETARARRLFRSFSTPPPRPFQKRPMKPAYRASPRCRKALTAGIQPGTSNVPTSDPSPLSYSLSEPHTNCGMERLWALGQFILGKCVAPCLSRLPTLLPEITGRARRLQAGWGQVTGTTTNGAVGIVVNANNSFYIRS